MMTPKEKALELYNRFFREVPFLQSDDDIRDDMNAAKRCALIAVDEMIAFSKHAFSFIHADLATPSIQYLEEVKQELEKL